MSIITLIKAILYINMKFIINFATQIFKSILISMRFNSRKKIKITHLIFSFLLIIIFPTFSNSQNASKNDSIINDSLDNIIVTKKNNDSITIKNTMFFQMPPIVPKKYHTLKTSGILLGASLVSLAVLWVMPPEFTRWNPDQSERIKDAGQNIKRSWTKPPVIDHDKWQLNYIAHPVGGMYTYLTERNHNRSIWRAFGYSLFTSCMWEYVIEGIAEQPSIQDLIVTPIGGAILGEGIFQLTILMRKNGFTLTEKIITTVINPIYVIQRGFK